MSKLMKPLFIDGMYNRENKRIRANYLKTITDGIKTYPLWIEDGKPNRDYGCNHKDKYYIYVEINGWLVMTGYTEHQIEEDSGYEYLNKKWYGDENGREKYFEDNFYNGKTFEETQSLIKMHLEKEKSFIEENRNNETIQVELLTRNFDRSIARYIDTRDKKGKFADFIGAVIIGELDKCDEIASVLKDERKIEQLEKTRIRKEKEERERIEQEQIEKLLIEETEKSFVYGGKVEDSRIIIKLADKYNVNIPLRTRGWILNNLSEVTISEGGNVSYRYWKKSKNAKGSQTVFDVLRGIISALKNNMTK